MFTGMRSARLMAGKTGDAAFVDLVQSAKSDPLLL